MKGMQACASDEYNKYTSQLHGVASAAEGQLLFLNNNLRSVLLDSSSDLNLRYYRASMMYVQILRIIYTMDRVHSLADGFWNKTSNNLNYVSGVANIDTHLFLKQVKLSCKFTDNANLMYRSNGDIQKAEINKNILSQAALWLRENNKDLSSDSLGACAVFFGGSYDSAMKSLLESGDTGGSSDTSKIINEDMHYSMQALRDVFTPLSRSIAPLSSSQPKSDASFKDYIQSKKLDANANLELNSIFAKHFMAFRKPKEEYTEVLNDLEERSLSLVSKIGSNYDWLVHSVSESSFHSKFGINERAITLRWSDEEKEHVKMEKAILPLLTFTQIRFLKSSARDSIIDMQHSEKDMFLSFLHGNEIKLPEKISKSELSSFALASKNPGFMEISMYELYVALDKLHKNSEDKAYLKQASDYFNSPSFLSRLYEISDKMAHYQQSGDNEQYYVLMTLLKSMKQFASSVRYIDRRPGYGVLSLDEWKREVSWDASYENLQHHATFFGSGFVHYYNNFNLRSLIAIDRYSYYSTKPLNDVELAVQPLMYSGAFINLPIEMKSKIICEYMLFEGNVLWHKESGVLEHTFSSLQRANDFGVSESIAISAIKGRGDDVIINDHSAVFDVISKGQNRALRALLEKGVNLEQKNTKGLTPLQEAVRLDSLFSVKLIMKEILKRDKVKGGSGKHSLPVSLAIESESTEVLNYFIDILGKDSMSVENLHAAAKKQSYSVVKLLLENGFDPEAVDSHGKKAIDYIAPGSSDLNDLFSGKSTDGVPLGVSMKMMNKALAASGSGKSVFNRMKSAFSACSKGVSSRDLWIRRVCVLFFVLAISSFVLAFIYPVNLFLNLALIFSYSAVFLEMYKNNCILPTSPKVYEVLLDTNILGTNNGSTSTVNNSLFFSLSKSDALRVDKADVVPVNKSDINRPALGSKCFSSSELGGEDSLRGLNMVKV